MKVFKFGGTSVGAPERMHQVAQIIGSETQKIVVLSAVSGTTNSLVEINQALANGNKAGALSIIEQLEKHYEQFVEGLYSSDDYKEKGRALIQQHFGKLKRFPNEDFSVHKERTILAQGELMSTEMFYLYLQENGVSSALLPALDFMRIDEDAEPDMAFIESHIQKSLTAAGDHKIYITQGFICRNPFGEIDNLKRGGSDYTASLIGAAIRAEEVQIWTDIDGMHNNDPRVVEETHPIQHLSFDEAAELAYFGAKILHPSSIRPAQERNIAVWLKNTMDPQAHGTKIMHASEEPGFKAVAAKDGITAIKIKSGRMLLAYGFLRSVFEVFERYKTPIDLITTSEVAVSLTIDETEHLNDIVKDLEKFGQVEVEEGQTIICIVGHGIAEGAGYASVVFDALKGVPIRMISFGGSRHNISLLVPSDQKTTALQQLNEGVFGMKGMEA